jgi:hypothetical protein
MTQAFNLSQFANKVNTSGQANLTTAVTGTLPVANGGTGQTTLTSNNVLLGNGTGGVITVAPSTSGNVLTSNGTTWISATGSSYTGTQTVIFTASGTFTPPAGLTSFRITVIGGGCGGGSSTNGGAGGIAIANISSFSGAITITIGAGGRANPQTAGGTTSATGTGVSLSATGGSGSTTGGVGTVTTGTALREFPSSQASNRPTLVAGAAVRLGGSGANLGIAYTVNGLHMAGAGGQTAGLVASIAGGVGGAVIIEY